MIILFILENNILSSGVIEIKSNHKLSNKLNYVQSGFGKYFVVLRLVLFLTIIFSGAVSASTLSTNNSHSNGLNIQSKDIIDHIDPVNNAVNVNSRKIISVNFKTQVKRGSGWIELKNNKGLINITKNYDTNILTINHSKPLVSGKYTLILHTGSIQTSNGRSLSLYITKFSVDNIPPKVTFNYPFNGFKGYSKNTPIYVKFGEGIEPGVKFNSIRIINLKTGKVTAITKKILNNSLYIISRDGRTANTWYRIFIPAGSVKDLAGNEIKTLYTFKFKSGLKDLQIAPINPSFLRSSTSSISDIMPSTVDYSLLKGNIFPSTTFPASYDLRTLNKVTSVKNQNPLGTCWAFATMGSLESCLLPNENWDFSENNMVNTNGFDMFDTGNYGGTYDMAAAYLARWSGPVKDTDDPYDMSLYNRVSPTGLNPVKHVQDIMVLPYRSSYLDNDNIKYAVSHYGAVATEMCYDDSYYNGVKHSYYYNSNANQNHGVCIVGWDDSYSRYNFNIDPKCDGAFIVKNSWGSSWGDGGYFYVSYNDTKLSTSNNRVSGSGNFVFYNAEQTTNYNKNYQYDPLGWVNSMGYESNTAWFSNVFSSTGNDIVSASSFYAYSPNSVYSLYAYLNPTDGNPRSGTLVDSQSGTVIPGYHTIILNTPFQVSSGDKFSIVVKLTTPGYNYPIPIEYALPNYSSKAVASSGQSYISQNGSFWEDTFLSGTPGSKTNVCLKAFTTPDYHPRISSVNPDNNAMTNNPNNDIKVTFTEPVTLDSGTVELKNSDGVPVSITTSIVGGNVLNIHPNSALSEGKFTLLLHPNCVKNQLGYDFFTLFTSSFSVDSISPTVKSAQPASGGFTIPGKDIKITFNEPVTIGSGTVELKNGNGVPVSITTSIIEGNVLNIHPNSALSNGVYNLILNSGCVKDLAGNLISSYTTKFTVEVTDPEVLSVDPVNNAVHINPNKIIKVTFSEPITLSVGNVQLQSSSGISEPYLSASGNILTITPQTSMHNGLYSLFLYPGSVTDLAGNPVHMFESYFTVDGIKPTIISTSSGLYNTSKLVSLTISEPGTIYYTTNGIAPTTSSKKYSSPFFVTSTTTVKFFAKDLAGNLSPVYTRVYTIDKKAPTIVSTTPANHKISVSRSTSVIIKFTENIKMSTYYNGISLKNISSSRMVPITKTIKGNTTTLKASTRLSPNTWYLVTIPSKAIKDMAGNKLAAAYIFRFKTGMT